MTHAETFAEKYDNVSSNIQLTKKECKAQNITAIVEVNSGYHFIFFKDYSMVALKNAIAEVISPKDTFALMIAGFELANNL